MPASAALQGLPIVSSTQPPSGESTGTTRGTLRCSSAGWMADTATKWSRLGGEPLSRVSLSQSNQGVYVGAGSSLVSSKLVERIHRWEYVDMADLLPEVRLSDREGESEKVLQKRPRCVTDIWSWLHCFGTYTSVLGPFYPQAIP